jgi:hypothetical protein
MILWLRRMPSNVAPIPASAVRERSLREWVLNSTRGAERLEGVGELQQLGFPVGARPLVRGSDPGPADFEDAMLRDDRHEPAAADSTPGGAIDRGKRPFRAGFGVGQGRLDPATQPGLVLRTHDRPLPERRVKRDQGEIREMIRTERLEADARAFEDDRLDPVQCWHRGMVAG